MSQQVQTSRGGPVGSGGGSGVAVGLGPGWVRWGGGGVGSGVGAVGCGGVGCPPAVGCAPVVEVGRMGEGGKRGGPPAVVEWGPVRCEGGPVRWEGGGREERVQWWEGSAVGVQRGAREIVGRSPIIQKRASSQCSNNPT